MTPNEIRTFRMTHHDCALLMLSDTLSGTVLAADSGLAYPQEYLDAICLQSGQLLQLAGPAAAIAAFHGPTGTRLVVRLPGHDAIALTCVVGPDTDTKPLLAALHALAETLAAEKVAA